MPGEVRWSITEADRPKGGDLELLQARERHLTSFPQASEETRDSMIARLFLRFPQGAKASSEEVRCYAMDLAEFPTWAIAKGITNIIQGRVPKIEIFRPSSLQVRAAVAAACEPSRNEIALIRAVLSARVLPENEPAPPLERRVEMAEELRKMLSGVVMQGIPSRPRAPITDPAVSPAMTLSPGAVRTLERRSR